MPAMFMPGDIVSGRLGRAGARCAATHLLSNRRGLDQRHLFSGG